MSTARNRQHTDLSKPDRVTWLADQIFTAFLEPVTGLTFYILDCGCIYYRRKFIDGNLDHKVGIYRNSEDGACEACMIMDGSWKGRVIDEVVIYNSKFQID